MDIRDHALEMAPEAAGNWQKFPSFAWYSGDRPHDADNFAIVETHHRDSGLLAQSNAAAIAKALEPFTEGDDPDVRDFSANHWAVGWTEGHAVRVLQKDGEPTAAFLALVECECAMADYPVLDDSDYSEREYDAALSSIADRENLTLDAPDGWADNVFGWLSENEQEELENTDGNGAYPSDESIARAVTALGFADVEECEDLIDG